MEKTTKGDVDRRAADIRHELEQRGFTITENGDIKLKKQNFFICDQDEYFTRLIIDKLRAIDAVNNYHTSDKGSGALFADVFKDLVRYNPDIKDFMYFDGTCWIKDTEGLNASRLAKVLVDALWQYAPEVETLNVTTDYRKYANKMCNRHNRNTMLQDAKDRYPIYNDDLDNNNYLLNCRNGILYLKHGKPEFMKHEAKLLQSKICNVEYNATAKCDYWLRFLDEIMQGDMEKIKYLQKIAGLCLTGSTKEEKIFILYGATTRNGKSTFVETLKYMLGDYAITMQVETLALKKNKDSTSPNEDIARLDGARMVITSEAPKNMNFSVDVLKQLTGRDTLKARNPYERSFEFIPKFKLIMNTNYLPKVTDTTVFTSERISIVTFNRHFTEEEQDKDLKSRLIEKRELSGILNWCIEGLELYMKEGLAPPETVKTATLNYYQSSDKIQNFINDCLVASAKNISVKSAYIAYRQWCDDNGYGVDNKSNFIAALKTKGLWSERGTVAGHTVRNVIKGYELGFFEFDEITPFDK